jgi:16S rRNA (guanine527-N7)-methyltransferase
VYILIDKYFPDLSSDKIDKLKALEQLYSYWNDRINVISRKDFDNFYTHHVLHSLAIAKYIDFKPDTNILDIGTGGGFPGLPLAILFDDVNFTLVDSIGKKIKVVKEISNALEINNIKAIHKRAENVEGRFDFVLSRAVTKLERFLPWIENKISRTSKHKIANGLIYLKGGDVKEELAAINKKYYIKSISDYFTEDFFKTKLIVYVKVE